MIRRFKATDPRRHGDRYKMTCTPAPIGAVWASGSWNDSAWCADTWAETVAPPCTSAPIGSVWIAGSWDPASWCLGTWADASTPAPAPVQVGGLYWARPEQLDRDPEEEALILAIMESLLLE